MNPTIVVYNVAKTPLPFTLEAIVASMQKYVDDFYVPIWSRGCTLKVGTGPEPGCWGMVFMDNADQPGALAYHDEENHMPLSKVFVETTLADGQDVAVSASHELVEMLGDPACNKFAMAGDWQTLWCYELADPVEGDFFPVLGLNMSNFVLPCFFEADPLNLQTKFDVMGILTAPFSLAKGGYASTVVAGNFNQIFGSQAKADAFAKEDRRGHRGYFRKAGV